MKQIDANAQKARLPPSQKNRLIRLIEMMNEDISELEHVINYCRTRIFEDKTSASTEKVLSPRVKSLHPRLIESFGRNGAQNEVRALNWVRKFL